MHVHGDNLSQKERHETKYIDATARKFLVIIRQRYDSWRKANQELKGPFKAVSYTHLTLPTNREG